MGVDFYTCANCKNTFPDCGSYFRCECGEVFCSTKCGQRDDGEPEDETIEDWEECITCMFCRFENVPDHQMVEFLLKKLNLTHEEAVVMFKEENEDMNKEDEFGHLWGMGWEDSDKPHPGFGGTTDIFGGYVDQCEKCGMYSHEFKNQFCGPIIRKYG